MPDTEVQRRPRNRKQLIVTAAAKQFERRGYHDASIGDIAGDVGITGPALYRHFRGKHELLVAAIEREIEQLETSYRDPGRGVVELLADAARINLRPNRADALWERNQMFLEPPQRDALGRRYDAALQPLRQAIADARPELSERDLTIITWATHGVISSGRAFEWPKLDRDRAGVLMAEAATAVTAVPGPLVPEDVTWSDASGRGHLLPASRREAALVSAVELFAARGFQAVGMDDIGAAAGISGPTLYHHFPGKTAILVTVIMRCLEALYFDLAAALGSTDEPGEALELTLASFVRINVAHGDALGALATEVVNVPEDERAPIRRVQQDYVNEWVALLTQVRTDRSAAEAEALVRTTQSVMNMLRKHLPADQGTSGRALLALGRAMVGLDQA
ncbi:TetR/AcrR family transcriptional regulator [Nocardioides sp. MAHUQ-72]|uniref:TetR/AcrR family transcriptional regulator n=1 Tax=unclassified Nocardioides TaxID=2615069 RepID=UPI003618296E